MNTYWVDYDFVGEQWNKAERRWEIVTGGEGCRLRCLKKNIKKEVVNKIFEYYGLMKFLRMTIHDCYITTDTEV